METNDKALLLFQLGPVQKFIAQAETVGDLRAGSEILSELTAAALRTVPDYGANVVFPAVDQNPELKGTPNRFLVFVPRADAERIAKGAAQAAQTALKRMADDAWLILNVPDGKKAAFCGQIEQFLQTTWAILKEPSGQMGADYKNIGKLMALRRNTRAFAAWHEEGEGEIKDYLSGKEAALDIKDDHSNRNSGRGAMNLIKKARANDDFTKKDKNDLGRYLAVIALDGDHMGERLSGFKTQGEHLAFSQKLAGFANWLKGDEQQIITSDKGVLIYAGGDDVLAVVKATAAIGVARELAAKFVEQVNEPGITASAGIAVGSTKVPLQDLVHAAHEAESRAKHGYGRDALALDVYKHSGEILKWGCKWSSNAFDIYDLLKQAGDISNFAYKLAGFLEPYAITVDAFDEKMRQVFVEETLHTLEQTEKAKKVLSADILERFLGEDSVKHHPEDYLGLFMCEAFIDRPRGE